MKFLIVAGAEVTDMDFFRKTIDGFAPDRIIAADSGAEHLERAGITPDVLLGDFDSIDEKILADAEGKTEKITLPVEKDDTDTAAAVDMALEQGADEILILGGIGSRFDHTYANVLLLKRCLDRDVRARLVNEHNEMELFSESFSMRGRKGSTVSFFAMFEDVELTLRGFHYPLEKYFLKTENPLAVSNLIEEDSASVLFEKGFVLSVISRD